MRPVPSLQFVISALWVSPRFGISLSIVRVGIKASKKESTIGAAGSIRAQSSVANVASDTAPDARGADGSIPGSILSRRQSSMIIVFMLTCAQTASIGRHDR